MTLEQFKTNNNIASLQVLKGKGRMFSETSAGTLFFSEDCDLALPLFVNRGAHDALWVGNNNGAEVVATL